MRGNSTARRTLALGLGCLGLSVATMIFSPMFLKGVDFDSTSGQLIETRTRFIPVPLILFGIVMTGVGLYQLTTRADEKRQDDAPASIRRCSHCDEIVAKSADTCRHCGTDLEAEARPRPQPSAKRQSRSEGVAKATPLPPTVWPLDAIAGEDLDELRGRFSTTIDSALAVGRAMDTVPNNPTLWIKELCVRMEGGTAAEVAAKAIPLDWPRGRAVGTFGADQDRSHTPATAATEAQRFRRGMRIAAVAIAVAVVIPATVFGAFEFQQRADASKRAKSAKLLCPFITPNANDLTDLLGTNNATGGATRYWRNQFGERARCDVSTGRRTIKLELTGGARFRYQSGDALCAIPACRWRASEYSLVGQFAVGASLATLTFNRQGATFRQTFGRVLEDVALAMRDADASLPFGVGIATPSVVTSTTGSATTTSAPAQAAPPPCVPSAFYTPEPDSALRGYRCRGELAAALTATAMNGELYGGRGQDDAHIYQARAGKWIDVASSGGGLSVPFSELRRNGLDPDETARVLELSVESSGGEQYLRVVDLGCNGLPQKEPCQVVGGSVDRQDPNAVGRAFIEAWIAKDEAAMTMYGTEDAVENSRSLPVSSGAVSCGPHGSPSQWQCDLVNGDATFYVLLERINVTWTVTWVAQAHG